MKYTNLGRTGLICSVISFGGIPIQRSDEANTFAVIDAMEAHGINFIDTARAYTVSEEYIGAALEGRREKFILASKSMSRHHADMASDVETSLKNLRTDFIDLYQIHNIQQKELKFTFSKDGAYQALLDAKAAGKIGHIGITTHSLDVLKLLVEEFSDRIETVMFPYNIVETQGHDVLALAREKGIGTIAMKPLAGGNLEDWKLALRFIAASDVCDISIPGMGSPEEVIRNANVSKDISPLTDDELKQCRTIREDLGSHFCRRCNYCAPCTVGIDIPTNFLLANYWRKYDLASWSISRYESMIHHAGECVQCGICESRCPYDLPIRDMLKDVADIFGK